MTDTENKMEDKKPVSFAYSSAATSRATSTSLSQYIDNFRVYGAVNNDGTYEPVFNNYKVTYTANSANTSSSNTANWEYVGGNQTIKYWDYNCPSYMFWAIAPYKVNAFKLSDGKVTAASMSLSDADLNIKDENGYYANLPFYTDPKVVEKSEYGKTVSLSFRSACSRIRFALYETVPGYVVKSVTFNGSTEDKFTISGRFNSKGTINLAYDNDNIKTTATMTASENVTSKSFGTLNYVLKLSDTAPENKLNSGDYLGTMSSNPSFAGSVENPGYYTYILPADLTNDTYKPQPLLLNITYTLLSTDGGGQEITKTGVVATVPAEYCHWLPNYSYTYLFKITDSNLTPITFVGWAANDNTDDNQIGTITPLDSYSITTHQEGDTDDSGIEYVTGTPIDITVINNDNDGNITKVTLAEPSTYPQDYVVIYHQSTTREWVVETTISDSTTPTSGVYKGIVTYDSGKAIFTPDVSGTYRVEYHHKASSSADDETLAIKIIKIKGEDVPIDVYNQWQSGSSNTTNW